MIELFARPASKRLQNRLMGQAKGSIRRTSERLTLELDWLECFGSGRVDTREFLQYTCRELPTARSV
jgi:hypothetical protein